MKNPIRRNRNIGTDKQGYSQDNEMVVPHPAIESKSFYEKLSDYKTVKKTIKGHIFRFVIEKTRLNSFHACTLEDIVKVLNEIPKEDYGELELIILRQPTRKQENLESVWGRLIYSYEFENQLLPAVIIEAVDLKRKLKWTKKLSVESQKEMIRLMEDGHKFILNKRFYEAEYELDNIRATQLYRTITHEFGHYVHYLEIVERPGNENENIEEWEKRLKNYHSLPSSQKEVFAHTYAQNLKSELEKKGIIPFNRILNKNELLKDNLNLSDFQKLKI